MRVAGARQMPARSDDVEERRQWSGRSAELAPQQSRRNLRPTFAWLGDALTTKVLPAIGFIEIAHALMEVVVGQVSVVLYETPHRLAQQRKSIDSLVDLVELSTGSTPYADNFFGGVARGAASISKVHAVEVVLGDHPQDVDGWMTQLDQKGLRSTPRETGAHRNY